MLIGGLKVGKAINTILKWVALPSFVVGIIIGLSVMYNLNTHRTAKYEVIQYCFGDGCDAYGQMLGEENDICGELYGEGMIYFGGYCTDSNETKMCIEENGYLWCIQKDGRREGETTIEIVDEIGLIKNEKGRLADENIKLSLELSESKEGYNKIEAVFNGMYPSVFYCYGNGNLNYTYEIEEINKSIIPVEGWELMNKYYLEQCALCEEGTRAWIECHDEGEWRAYTVSEYNNCKSCAEDERYCLRGHIDKEEIVTKPVDVMVKLQPNNSYTRIDLSYLSYKNRARVYEQIKDKECYTTKKKEIGDVQYGWFNVTYAAIYINHTGNGG